MMMHELLIMVDAYKIWHDRKLSSDDTCMICWGLLWKEYGDLAMII